MTPNFAHIYQNVSEVLDKIQACAEMNHRHAAEIELEIAIKTRSATEALHAGLALEASGRRALLAHNRVQEAQATTPILRDGPLSSFHSVLIGNLQRNKINAAVRVFDEIESVDSLALARALSQRLDPTEQLPIMLQVNTSRELSKSGLVPEVALETALEIADLPGLLVTGFMTIGAHTTDQALIGKSFANLRAIRDEAIKHPSLKKAINLSMGMSSDFELAIAEGSTRIRIGNAVFGPRL
ncbi:YggS family pyridoxal phosphate-dependent enzyme [Gleimia coleocanis]|nr:YggS family pyridoxal phosphate-dependent enzyme [Gleimia coleocanis]